MTNTDVHFTIIDLASATDAQREEAARILHEEFNQEKWGFSWPELDEAREEVAELCKQEHICRAAVDADGHVLGWVGGLPEYDGNVWELHPIVVSRHLRGKGLGRALVHDLEDQVRRRGGLTVMLGTDDHSAMTSLGGANLYENLWDKINNIQNYKDHPFSFYFAVGYVIIGVMPDANGPGKPDIFMGKSLIQR
jgi:aminoglycoside 6'-N-acetyltransferase I